MRRATALLAALAFTLAGTWLAVLGGVRADARATEAARRATCGLYSRWCRWRLLVLMTALLRDDFSVRYVAEHSMRASPDLG